jgi:hypothetical protein
MRLAVDRFRTRMESANRQFLQDRINEIEAMHLSTEEENLHEMRDYWPDLGVQRDLDSWHDDVSRDLIRDFTKREMSRD